MVLGRDMETCTEAVICNNNNLAIENLLHKNLKKIKLRNVMLQRIPSGK